MMQDNNNTVGLVCATSEELSAVESVVDEAHREKGAGGFTFIDGNVEGRPIVVVMPRGDGKAAAGAATALLVERFHPDAIISFGASGALSNELSVGDIVVPEATYQADFGVVHGDGFFQTGTTVTLEEDLVCVKGHPSDPSLLELARKVSGGAMFDDDTVHFGACVTCDQFVIAQEARNTLFEAYQALAVDMESGAVAEVASFFDTPFIATRAISDPTELDIRGVHEYYRYLGVSRAAWWTKKAKFFTAHPVGIVKIRELSAGMETASGRAAAFAVELIKLI